MCKNGDTRNVYVPIPGDLSHTGKPRWDIKTVDRCIAALVEELNGVGELTAGSCCGHGRAPGSIVFHDGRELSPAEAEDLLKRHGLILGKRLHPIDPGRHCQAVHYPEWDEFHAR